MKLDKLIQDHIAESFRDPRQKHLHREFEKSYEVKGNTRTRPVQFLRPQVYCYAYPEYFSELPASQPASEFITAKITNSGGAASTNTIVQLTRFHESDPPSIERQRISLQPGQTKELKFEFSALAGTRSSRYSLACYDPLHDPVTPKAIVDSALINGLQNALYL